MLDLYAGSGALGVEAVSRGAAAVVFVERAPRCLSVLRANIESLGLGPVARIVRGDAPRAIQRLGRSGQRFDLVLLDPPYASDEAGRALEALVASGILARGALGVVESGRRHPVPAVAGLVPLDERRYGETVITRLSAPGAEQNPGGAGDG